MELVVWTSRLPGQTRVAFQHMPIAQQPDAFLAWVRIPPVIRKLNKSQTMFCNRLVMYNHYHRRRHHHNHHYHHWQNCPFWAIAFLRRFCQIASGFYFFWFRNNDFFYSARLLSLRPTPNLEDQEPVFMSPSDMVAPGSVFVPFYKSQSKGLPCVAA
jgi:hypothetical protein